MPRHAKPLFCGSLRNSSRIARHPNSDTVRSSTRNNGFPEDFSSRLNQEVGELDAATITGQPLGDLRV
jgi:hypothetical protein